jgi:hypothetical protein
LGVNLKVFISWSGERSQKLAQYLKDWLPLVLHPVEPWLSKEDISAGERWAQSVAKELESSNFGIICITRENVNSPWILFEAGSLSKFLQGEGSRVIPLLLDLELREISGPLAQFQAKKVDKEGLCEVIKSINQTITPPVPDARVAHLFEALWPQLENNLSIIPKTATTPKITRPQNEIFEELVTGVRSLDNRLRTMEDIVESSKFRNPRMRINPMIIESFHAFGSFEDPIGILIGASILRNDYPWLYEMGKLAYEAAKSGDPAVIKNEIIRIRALTENIRHFDLMMPDSKEAYMLTREFPLILENFLQRYMKDERKARPRIDNNSVVNKQ